MTNQSKLRSVVFDSLSAWSKLLTYLFACVFAIALTEWSCKFAFEQELRTGEWASKGVFLWWLQAPASYVAMTVAVVFTRFLIRACGWFRPDIRLFRWFHPSLAARDIGLLGLGFGLTYIGVYIGAARVPFEQISHHYVGCNAAIVIITSGEILLLDFIRWLTPGAVYPKGKYRYAFLALYGVNAIVAMTLADDLFASQFKGVYYPTLLLFSTALLIATILMLTLTQLLIWALGHCQGELSFPIDIRLAIVGQVCSGKTLLFTQGYRELRQAPVLGVRIRARESEATSMLVQHASNVERGILPPPSLVPALFDFELLHFQSLLANYSWLDMPGETFNNWSRPGEEWRERREFFLNQLSDVSGLIILINAYRPEGSVGEYQEAYSDCIDAFLMERCSKESVDMSATLAIVVTQWIRRGANQNDAKLEVERIKDHARNSAINLGITKFNAKIFYVDSISNASDTNNNQPLGGCAFQAWHVTKPILWLASCACRSQVGAREMARMPFIGEATTPLKVIAVLEQLENDAN